MAFITYRVSTSPTVPTVTTAKGLQLLNTEVDGNFKSLDVSKLETNGSAASLTAIPMGSAAGILAVANGGTGSSAASTGTGGVVLSNSPTLVAPSLGVPAFIDLTNARYLPLDGAISVTGKLPIAFGGTNALATPTAGAVPYGTGTAYAFTGVGTAGQVLTSAGAGIPTWTTVTTSAGGSNTQLQYNSSGSFAGSANMTFNGTTLSIASGLVGSNANFTDFPNARFVSSQANTGDSHIYNAGVAGEGVATDIAGGGQWGVGVYGVGATTGSTRGIGIVGDGAVSSSSDSAASIGVRGYATNTHSGGQNIGLYAQATGGGTNFALFMASGNIYSAVAQTWSLSDNETSALSFDTTGKAGVLKIITTDAAEGVTMSGTLGVTGTTLHTGKVTTLGQVQTPDVTSLLTTANTYPTTRPSLNLDFANSATLDPRITFTRGTNATYTGSDGLVKNTAGINSPRFDWDPVTRECKGLLIEEARTNLWTYSNDFDNAYWTKTNGAISANATTAPDGTTTADKFVEAATTANKEVARGSLTVVAGTSYTISIYAKAVERTAFRLGAATSYFTGSTSAFFELSNGTIPFANQGGFTASTITSVGNGWYRCTATFVPTVSGSSFSLYHTLMSGSTSGYLGDGTSGMFFWGAQLEEGAFATSYIPSSVTWTGRASTASYVGSNGLIQTAASGVARYQYNPTNLSVAPFLLLEPAATNLFPYSESLAGGGGGGTRNLDAGIIDPAGNTNTVYYCTTSEWTTGFNGGSATTISVSFFAKLRTGSGVDYIRLEMFQSVTGTVVNIGTYDFYLSATNADSGYFKNITRTAYPNGWYRFTCNVVANTSAAAGYNYFTVASRLDIEGGSSSNYIWGIQVETGSVATSYIPTVASQVTRIADTSTSAQTTRSADVATMTNSNFSSWYNQTEGTLFAEVIKGFSGNFIAYPHTASLSNGTDTNGIWLGYGANAGNVLVPSINVNSAGQLDYIDRPFTTLNAKIALAYKVNDTQWAFNGTTLTTDTNCQIPIVDRLNIGGDGDNTNKWNGYIKSIRYYPTRLSNSTLQALTT